MKNLIAQIGTISPGTDIPDPGADPTNFIAGIIRGGIQLLIVVSFVVALFWTIFAGFRFITASGDPKTTGQAWQQIYFGLIGMIIIVGIFAIIRLIEGFFQVNIISNGLILPQR